MSSDIDVIMAETGGLFALKERLAKLIVLGPWRETPSGWERPEAGQPESRIRVWESHAEANDMEPGWYFRFGFGVLCISGISGTKAYPTAQDCMATVDKMLAKDEFIITA